MNQRIFITISLFFFTQTPFLFGSEKKTPPENNRKNQPISTESWDLSNSATATATAATAIPQITRTKKTVASDGKIGWTKSLTNTLWYLCSETQNKSSNAQDAYRQLQKFLKHRKETSPISLSSAMEASNEKGYTPFLYLIRHQKNLFAFLLLKYGANVHHKDIYGNCALHFAVANNDLKATQQLLTNKWRTRMRTKTYRTKVFSFSEIISRSDINSLTVRKLTPLMIAIIKRYLEITKYLLNMSADVTLVSVEDKTAALFAQENAQEEVYRLLIEKALSSKSKNLNLSSVSPHHFDEKVPEF